MIRRPPISTRTDTLFPYTTLFRSEWLNVPDSKSGVRENVPGVRIPPSPPQNKRADSMSAFLLCRIEKREGFEAAAAAGPVGESLPLRHKIKEPTQCRSEEHTSELQSLMRISYAVSCLKKTNTMNTTPKSPTLSNKPSPTTDNTHQ